MSKKVRIGCFSGFWGDTATGAAQLVKGGDIDYLVGDYLAEVTMAILAKMKKAKKKGGMGEGGYVREFAVDVFSPLCKELKAKGIKVVTNAGGMNPLALKALLENICQEQGVEMKIAAVTGDDLYEQFPQLLKAGKVSNFSIEGEVESLPASRPLMSSNAYIGSFPVAAALDAGAEVVITGRSVDSAFVLGPLIHEFSWERDQYDLLAAGSVAGHVIECGCHATGGNFTDWTLSQPGWDNAGFPIAECFSDGSFVLTKPPGTGGLVSRGTVSEQLVYEIHDPANYFLPDVIVDFTEVTLEELTPIDGEARILVKGAKGKPPTLLYKVSNTYLGPYKLSGSLLIAGKDARAKGLAVGNAIISKTRRMFKERNFDDYLRVNIEALGSEWLYGDQSRDTNSREIVLRISATHKNRKALQLLAKEITPSALAMAPGITGGDAGRPQPSPQILYHSCLIPKSNLSIKVHLGESVSEIDEVHGNGQVLPYVSPPTEAEVFVDKSEDTITVPLSTIAYGRSGDKGDVANIGIVCRHAKFFSIVGAQVTASRVHNYMPHLLKGICTRYVLPGITAYNFVCTKSLDSGGASSLSMDRQGKCYAQILLDLPVLIPRSLLAASKFLFF
eukprot:TRINITY_DN3406_c0_g1_i1.p1 TRINITY_DN3406_c0_g1~~TRINITY_DN3406_c0_g1_i1.p1  ORF type:complete len:647 (+),score=137.19 TRINITY_DN3406_c0_g1_i1:93-1943(+)